MPWALVLRETESKQPVLLTSDMTVAADDDHFERDVHIVPVTEDGVWLTFGKHDFSRECYCSPEVKRKIHGRYMVEHHERVQ